MPDRRGGFVDLDVRRLNGLAVTSSLGAEVRDRVVALGAERETNACCWRATVDRVRRRRDAGQSVARGQSHRHVRAYPVVADAADSCGRRGLVDLDGG